MNRFPRIATAMAAALVGLSSMAMADGPRHGDRHGYRDGGHAYPAHGHRGHGGYARHHDRRHDRAYRHGGRHGHAHPYRHADRYGPPRHHRYPPPRHRHGYVPYPAVRPGVYFGAPIPYLRPYPYPYPRPYAYPGGHVSLYFDF